MPTAFKEWAVTVRALAEGEQLITLRKGGIREENKHFEIEHDFDPLFKLAHMLKDVRHCLAEADRLGARMALGRMAESAYSSADRKGLGEQDFSAVVEVVEEALGNPSAQKPT